MSEIPEETPVEEKIERMRFLSVFDEDKNENLILKINLRNKGEEAKKGESFRKNEKIVGIDFHLLRYLDMALIPRGDETYDLIGFFAQK